MDRQLDAIEARLLQWADSYRRGIDGPAWYPEKASGGFLPAGKDSEEQAEAHEADQASQIDACIHSLLTPHRIVIYKRFNVGYNLWKFGDELAVFEAAKAEIEPMLRKRCLI